MLFHYFIIVFIMLHYIVVYCIFHLVLCSFVYSTRLRYSMLGMKLYHIALHYTMSKLST